MLDKIIEKTKYVVPFAVLLTLSQPAYSQDISMKPAHRNLAIPDPILAIKSYRQAIDKNPKASEKTIEEVLRLYDGVIFEYNSSTKDTSDNIVQESKDFCNWVIKTHSPGKNLALAYLILGKVLSYFNKPNGVDEGVENIAATEKSKDDIKMGAEMLEKAYKSGDNEVKIHSLFYLAGLNLGQAETNPNNGSFTLKKARGMYKELLERLKTREIVPKIRNDYMETAKNNLDYIGQRIGSK